MSRTIPGDYTQLSVKAETICDNRGNKIELTKVVAEGNDDNFLHIKSDQKLKKEASIDNKFTLRLEAQLTNKSFLTVSILNTAHT